MTSKSEDTNKLINQLRNLESPNEAREMLKERGESCIGESMLKKARETRKGAKNEEEIIKNLKAKFSLLKEIDGKLYMVYPKCYCHHLGHFKGKIPKNYCYCSEFWIKRLFKEALRREVKVEIEKSVRWGDKNCRIRIDRG